MAEDYTGVKFRTLFKGSRFGDEEIRKMIVTVGKKLGRLSDMEPRSGNISVRTEGGFVITPTGVDLRELESGDMVLVTGYDEVANIAEVIGTKQPSSETVMHLMIYREFPKARAIIHVHYPQVLENSERFETTEKYFPYGTKELGAEAVKALKKSRLIVLKDHGLLVTGKNLDSCYTSIGKALKSLV